jgi:hypothetical protein
VKPSHLAHRPRRFVATKRLTPEQPIIVHAPTPEPVVHAPEL